MFKYPFEGRPSKLQMSGLFIFHPHEYLKLFVASINTVARESGNTKFINFLRRLERWQPDARADPKMEQTLLEMLDFIPHGDDDTKVLDNFVRAATGDTDARAWVESLGLYEALLLGFGRPPSSWNLRDAYLVELEGVGCSAIREIHRGDVRAAIISIEKHPISSQLLWPNAIDSFVEINNFNKVTPQRAAMAMEAHLGWLAAWDVSVTESFDYNGSMLAELLPSNRAPGRNPTSLLFDVLKRHVGAGSVGEIVDMVPSVSAETFYRWSAGKQFPDIETLEAVDVAYGFSQDGKTGAFHHQVCATKLINLIGYICQDISAKARAAGSPVEAAPWPGYPFGYPDFESWAAARYPFWLAYLREHGEALVESAKTSHAVI